MCPARHALQEANHYCVQVLVVVFIFGMRCDLLQFSCFLRSLFMFHWRFYGYFARLSARVANRLKWYSLLGVCVCAEECLLTPLQRLVGAARWLVGQWSVVVIAWRCYLLFVVVFNYFALLGLFHVSIFSKIRVLLQKCVCVIPFHISLVLLSVLHTSAYFCCRNAGKLISNVDVTMVT